MKNYIGFIVIVCILSSCKTQNLFSALEKDQEVSEVEMNRIFHSDTSYQYTIRKDDKISISVWGQDELSVGSVYSIYNSNEVYGKWLLVDSRGSIEIPKIGTTHVEGQTIVQLKDQLKASFQEWIKNPIVDIKVMNKEITVIGEVIKPGVFTVDTDRNKLLDLIAKSGGFDSYANLEYIKVLRQVGPDVYVLNIDLTQAGNYLQKNISLHPSDVVIIPSKGYKEFDKRVSVIIPLTSTVSASAILLGL